MTETTWADWQAQGRRVESSGGAVAAYDVGDPAGERLTFLHGFPSSSHDIVPALGLLQGGWRVLAIDLPGFGAADKPTGHRYTIHAAVDATIAVWAELGVDRTVLVVHDYSVSLGQELLARRAEGTLGVDVTAVVWMNGGLFPDLHRPTIGQQSWPTPSTAPRSPPAWTRPGSSPASR